MRVVYLDHCALHSGAELALARLLPALSTAHPLVILGEDGPLASTLRGNGIAVQVFPMSDRSRNLRRSSVTPSFEAILSMRDSLLHALRLSRQIRAERADLIVTNSLKAALYGGVAGRLAGIPVLWHVHDRVAPDYLPRSAIILMRAAARILPSGIIANSRETLTCLSLSPRATARIDPRVIGNACSLVDRPMKGRVERTTDDPIRVGIIGRLSPWKGQNIFLHALSRSRSLSRIDARVIGGALFGEDTYAESLQALARELDVADHVRFTGHVEDVETQLDSLDILVHASTVPEPFGQVVVEGMAAGVVVVAANAGGPSEIIDDSLTGLLFTPGQSVELAECIDQLIDDAGLRTRLAVAANRSVQRFSPAVIADQMEQAYSDVVRRRRKRWSHRT